MNRWYGGDPDWRMRMESVAVRQYGDRLTVSPGRGSLTYRIDALEVHGDRARTVAVQFLARPVLPTYGLPAQDFPRVYAAAGALSPHRHPDDDALCLWYPWHPPSRRWVAADGLAALLEITRDHLFAERWWRATGEWVLDEAPHGLADTA